MGSNYWMDLAIFGRMIASFDFCLQRCHRKVLMRTQVVVHVYVRTYVRTSSSSREPRRAVSGRGREKQDARERGMNDDQDDACN